MKIADYIRGIFEKRANHTLTYGQSYIPDWQISRHRFGETVFLNIVEILTDLYNEVIWTSLVDSELYVAWKSFVDVQGLRLLIKLYRGQGYAVIGYGRNIDGGWWFRELQSTEYTTVSDGYETRVQVSNPDISYYVLKSPTFESTGQSDHQLCAPYIAMLDAVANSATTTAERLGAFVIITPDSDGSQFGGVYTEEQKKKVEEELGNEYGSLKKQKQIMSLPRPMKTSVVSLAGVDMKFNEKARFAILAICDRIKVPANQVAIIDANSSKSLSNGNELREGDMAKYRSFRRLLNATLFDFATEIGLRVNYEIENEPKSQQGQQIETV